MGRVEGARAILQMDLKNRIEIGQFKAQMNANFTAVAPLTTRSEPDPPALFHCSSQRHAAAEGVPEAVLAENGDEEVTAHGEPGAIGVA